MSKTPALYCIVWDKKVADIFIVFVSLKHLEMQAVVTPESPFGTGDSSSWAGPTSPAHGDSECGSKCSKSQHEASASVPEETQLKTWIIWIDDPR